MESDPLLRKGTVRPPELDEYQKLKLGLIREPWKRSAQWTRDMVTIATIADHIELERSLERMAGSFGGVG